jgi:gamma-glutamyl hercynylcysteine S-oxide synthase
VEEARKRVEESRRESEGEIERGKRDLESAATILSSQSPGERPPSAATPGLEQITQAAVSSAQMDPTVFAPFFTDAPLPSASEQEQYQTLKVSATVQQSHPSLQGSPHTQPAFTSIPDLDAAKPSRTLSMVIGGLVLLVVVAVGLVVAIYSWRHSGIKPEGGPRDSSTQNSNINASSTSPAPPEMVKVEGGKFRMGQSDIDIHHPNPKNPGYDLNQWPAHEVGPVKDFYMDRTEVTNAEYASFVKQTNHPAPSYWKGSKPPDGQEQWPVTNVSVDDANAFAQWRSKRDKVSYRLPTEEEWEYTARNGSNPNLYPWGDQWLDDRANVDTNSPRPVGSFPEGKTPGGIVDLIGNVWEWTSTRAALYPGNSMLRSPQPGMVVIRGGSYLEPPRGPEAITATRRSFVAASAKDATIGFRLVRNGP